MACTQSPSTRGSNLAGQLRPPHVKVVGQTQTQQAYADGGQRQQVLGLVGEMVRRSGGPDRPEEIAQAVRVLDAEGVGLGHAEEPADGCEPGQHPERIHQHRGLLLHVLPHVRRRAGLTGEDLEIQAPHVEGGDSRGHEPDGVEPGVAGYLRRVGHHQDLVLREEARERWEAGDRHHPHPEDRVGLPDAAAQATHLLDVLLVVHGQDH